MQASSRIAALDSVRGIAALLVVLHHATFTLDDKPAKWLFAVVGGRPSVIVFFVLSGYVLAHSLIRRDEPLLPFAIRRICRIWLPFAVALLIAAGARYLVDPHPIAALTEWFGRTWPASVTPEMIVRHLLMTGSEGDTQLDGVAWSLVYEVRISLFFPIIVAATVRWPTAALISALLLHVASAAAIGCDAHCEPYYSISFRNALAVTSYFVVFFVAGIWIRLCGGVFSRLVSTVPVWGIAICAAVLLSIKADLSLLLGAALIIGAAATGAFDRLLLRPIPLWLGRVSYSLYLVHMIVMLGLVYSFHEYLPMWEILPMSVALSLVLSEGFYRLVEAKAQRLGKFLVKLSVKPRPAAASQASRR